MVLAILVLGPALRAETGDAASAYERGDYKQAFHAFKRLAEQGDAVAQTSLGVMYELGRGTARNNREAVRWYREAATRRHAAAQYDLAGMYRNGEGVPTDLTLAYAWYSLAASYGASDEERQQAQHARENCAEQLSPPELARAKEIARIWLSDSTVIGLSPPPSSPGDLAPDSITAFVQEGLASLGYDPGPADGIAGPKTFTAIRAFQKDQMLPVTGDISDALAGAILEQQARVAPSQVVSLDPASTGPGVAVNPEGYILTNLHVVSECNGIRITPNIDGVLVASDRRSDLALIKTDGVPAGTAIFRSGQGLRPGDPVILAGLPKSSGAVNGVDITTGTVRSFLNSGGNRDELRITADARPQAIGGPILDLSSHVVGIADGAGNGSAAPKVDGKGGAFDFAMDVRTARQFLDRHNVPYETAPSAGSLSPGDVAAMARRFIVVVECWK